ncbi:D-3-phosphoglycerate dehydrogenase [Candidatus Kryptobacter tengchongensis]|uniref:D-3-phosphoglycerate dehydrogenase n=1 Tax=Kryptobacter tengchongensis TaxID=1643429 RepID=A0A656CXR4_KRYT1|nr:phosphoglycerate dehydrogenase [Candidatus Kryptobacter tengchongensis]CUS79337.1 D-3-phosphoglycerate dehydrogenase [Candidatus Kryptobacter tengchongensis]CUT03625.1 D-3-phosphoglycerate dehydrogenase [Candidatus Kryptobacter tengchongensis]CUU10946.1 D-3-phosphoglycerate dehydrogenase [Candidatus Kryptobacter tengchongensis]
MKILITDPIEESCVNILKSEGFTVDLKPGITKDEIKRIINDYVALIVRSGTRVTADIINEAKNLKIIGRAGAGVDNIDVDAATRRGIIVMNTPGGNTISTAEHTMSLILALARNIPQACEDLKSGNWNRKKFIGVELYGKTIGIIGLGRIGREVAIRCKAFGMNVIGYDPVVSSEVARKFGVELVAELDEIYRRSDFITVHVPLNEETRGMIGKNELLKCKRGVRIINCARGGIIDEMALLEAIESGHVAGAALDVFSEEPPPKDHPLIKHPKVIVTPHLGAATEEAQEKVAVQIAQQIVDALKERAIVGAVNAEILQLAMNEVIKPYLLLAEKIGLFQAQILKGKVKSVTGIFVGEMLKNSSQILISAFLKGMLNYLMSEPVNYINAPVIAREIGLSVSEKVSDDSGNYTHLLRFEVKTDKETKTVSGTVFGNNDIRIVGVDEFHFEFKPEGILIVYSNIDKPGMLASVSSILARSEINIAGLSLGRYGVGQKALTVMSVDNEIPQNVLREISSIDGIFDVKIVKL